MDTLEDSLTQLSVAEAQQMLTIARQRQAALARGRAVFKCTVNRPANTVAALQVPMACIRLEYHWDGEARWHARAWDAQGALISDTASDGNWVEADGGSLGISTTF